MSTECAADAGCRAHFAYFIVQFTTLTNQLLASLLSIMLPSLMPIPRQRPHAR